MLIRDLLKEILQKIFGEEMGGVRGTQTPLFQTYPPLMGPQKGMNKENKDIQNICSSNARVLQLKLLVFTRGPGGLREAGRNHVHRSWYLEVPVVTSYDQKSRWGQFSSPITVS